MSSLRDRRALRPGSRGASSAKLVGGTSGFVAIASAASHQSDAVAPFHGLVLRRQRNASEGMCPHMPAS